MKALCLTNSKLTAFWNGSGTSWTPILKCFLKYLHAKMISTSDKNTKMKILQNTCVFTVKMHFRNLNNITTTLKKTLVFAHQALTKQRSKSDPPLDLKISPSSRPKTGLRAPKNDIQKDCQTIHQKISQKSHAEGPEGPPSPPKRKPKTSKTSHHQGIIARTLCPAARWRIFVYLSRGTNSTPQVITPRGLS